MEIRVPDKTAIVTGGSSGIGAAVARTLAEAGARVAVVGRDEERLAGVCDEIRAAGGTCLAISADLNRVEAAEEIVNRTRGELGSVDILVHAAGVFGPKPFLETSVTEFDATLSINVRAPFALTQAAVPHMEPGSVVVFVSSIDGHVGFASDSAYGPSKSAVDGLTRALSIELAPLGIRVVAVAPGFTATPMNEGFRQDPANVEAAVRETPAGRLASVDDIAGCVLFLASPAADYTHGAILTVDGGYPASPLQRGMSMEAPESA